MRLRLTLHRSCHVHDHATRRVAGGSSQICEMRCPRIRVAGNRDVYATRGGGHESTTIPPLRTRIEPAISTFHAVIAVGGQDEVDEHLRGAQLAGRACVGRVVTAAPSLAEV